jgi:benzil reductase ((S)-benzoin forming)
MSGTQRAIVTGHSRGLGAAIAADLLHRGMAVLGVSRSGNGELAAEHGDALTEVALDLSDSAATAQWLQSGDLTSFLEGSSRALLVNNAGVLQPLGRMETQDLDAVTLALTLNVTAAIALTVAFAQATRNCPDRRILHISSGAGRRAYAGWSVYCASKAALDHHARAVAVDQSPGLRIAAIAPGVVDTEMQALIRSSREEDVPDRQRFVDMKLAPSDAARRCVELMLSPGYGEDPIV